MLLDDNGLKIEGFDPVLAEILGNASGEEGSSVLKQTQDHEHLRVELRDWLYCLALAPGTLVRKNLIDEVGKQPDKFVSLLEDVFKEDSPPDGDPPDAITSKTAAPEVMTMLDACRRIAGDAEERLVDDAVLTLAFFETADSELLEMISAWASEERMRLFMARVRDAVHPLTKINLFREDGLLDLRVFSASGRRFCQRLREDVQSLDIKKITTRHILYTLLGSEGSAVSLALASDGVDVKKELHSALTRELVKLGAKRNNDLELTSETFFEASVLVFEEAFRQVKAAGRSLISEFDISRAFVRRQPGELSRLKSGGSFIDAGMVSNYIETMEFAGDEEESPIHRYTVGEIERNVNERICGQKAAVNRVIPWIKRLRYGIPRDGRPAAVFLFLGPTGSGKTQLAKELARYVFGDEDMVIFLEMGQFKTKESMSMFIGAAPGYVGYGDGKLTNGLRDKPECVVLFDEIEKADPQVFDTVLRFADEGVISDPAGPIRDGRKCIIVMTTNAGQKWLRDHLASDKSALDNMDALSGQLFKAAMEELDKLGFRPEFLGRVDERVVFFPFTVDVCREIVDQVLMSDLEKFRKLRNLKVDVDDDVRKVLADEAHKRSMEEGARGVPRTINEYIVTPVVDLIAENEEKGDLPARIKAVVIGMSKIKWEVVE